MPTNGICQRRLPLRVPPDSIFDVGSPDTVIYKALFDLSQSIAGHSDLETLCNSLAGSLRRVVSFDFLGLVLHDPVHDVLRLHAISTDRQYVEKDKYVALPTNGDHIGALVWHEQRPQVLSPLDAEMRWSDVIREMLDKGIHALTLVPLSNGNRRLGNPGIRIHGAFSAGRGSLAVPVPGGIGIRRRRGRISDQAGADAGTRPHAGAV